ncbi:MAG: PH domain-containing protein [Lachnospiraceae bacterium]|nr:PH domain-containing protein [Lachnospiraceae bacterium]
MTISRHVKRRTFMDYLWSDKKRTFLGLPLSFTRYSLTDERLFIEQGFLNKKEDEVRLYRIMDVSLSRSFGQRLFGLGTIHCCSADKSMKDFDILSIKHPKEVKEQLSELVEKQRDSKRVTNREFMTDHHDMDDDYDDDYDHN